MVKYTSKTQSSSRIGLKFKTTNIHFHLFNKVHVVFSRMYNYSRSPWCSNNQLPWDLESIVPRFKTFIRITRSFNYATSERL